MAYEFKKLSDVNAIEAVSANTNVLVEENGEIVKVAANSLVPEDVVTQGELEAAIENIPEPVTSWNDLQDKPFGEEVQKITVVPLQTYENYSAVTLEQTWNSLYRKTVIAVYDGVRYETQAKTQYTGGQDAGCIGNGALYQSYYFADTGEPFVVYEEPAYGSNAHVRFADEGTHTLEIYVEEAIIAPIPETYLPTTVPAIQSAQVGQTIAVKAVDENGRPTEWEAVDTAKSNSSEVFIIKVNGGMPGDESIDVTYGEIYAKYEEGALIVLDASNMGVAPTVLSHHGDDVFEFTNMSLSDAHISIISYTISSDGNITYVQKVFAVSDP